MSRRISMMCKKEYEFEGKVCLIKGGVYTFTEEVYNDILSNFLGRPGIFYDYFYTKEEMRDIRLQEIGI